MSIIIPSSPNDRKTIKDAMTEISNSMVRIDSEKAYIKDAIEALNDKVDIDKKYLNKLARVYHKQTLTQVTSEMEDLEALYESCLK
jgi:CBS-domain-containing membrane protein|tara:strand:+ start:875 stop:1132 length:258 start_codon:yes stop_codon:yes gene_type:complete